MEQPNTMVEQTLGDKLARDILGRIRGGQILPGAKLNAKSLADDFRVSRTPVLEALKTLAARGIATHAPNRGYIVSSTALNGNVGSELDEPVPVTDLYYRLAEDWVGQEIPQDVTEQYLLQRYKARKSEVVGTLVRAVNEGWAERKPGYGWTFLPVVSTPEAFEQVYRFRSAIEPAALLEPTFEFDTQVLDEQERIQQRYLDGAIDTELPDRLILIGMQFHEEIIRLSGNTFFHQALVRVNRLRHLLELRSIFDRARVYDQFSGHLELIRLLRKGDPIEASFYMRQHLAEATSKKTSIQRAHVQNKIRR